MVFIPCSTPEPGDEPSVGGPCPLLLLVMGGPILPFEPAEPSEAPSLFLLFLCEPICDLAPVARGAPASPFLLLVVLPPCSPPEPLDMCGPTLGLAPGDVSPPEPAVQTGEAGVAPASPLFLFVSETFSGFTLNNAPPLPVSHLVEVEVSTTSLHLYVSEPGAGLSPGGAPATPDETPVALLFILCGPIHGLAP